MKTHFDQQIDRTDQDNVAFADESGFAFIFRRTGSDECLSQLDSERYCSYIGIERFPRRFFDRRFFEEYFYDGFDALVVIVDMVPRED